MRLKAILLLMMFLPAALWAQQEGHYVRYYGITDGLSDQNVLSSFYDSQGFVWVSTANGLNRFDGHSFVYYSPESHTENTRINGDNICGVVEDRCGNIWGGSSAGLFRISSDRSEITTFEDSRYNDYGSLSSMISDIALDSDGDIWLCSGNLITLLRLDENGNPVHVSVMGSDERAHYSRLSIGADGLVWTSGVGAVSCFQKTSSVGLISKVLSNRMEQLSSVMNSTAVYCSGEHVYFGSPAGLHVYDTTSGGLEFVDTHYPVTYICRAGDNQILVGTTEGVLSYDPVSGDIRLFGDKETALKGRVNHIMVDGAGNCWIGTSLDGLCFDASQRLPVSTYLAAPYENRNTVSCVYQNSSGHIFAAIRGKGLAIKDPHHDSFAIYPLSTDAGIHDNIVNSICEDKDGHMWMASENYGLVKVSFRPSGGLSFKTFSLGDSYSGNNSLMDWAYDRTNNGFWVLVNAGLIYFDINTETVMPVTLSSFVPGGVSFSCVSIDDNDCLWVGGYGVLVIDLLSFNKSTGRYDSRYFNNLLSDSSEGVRSKVVTIEQAGSGEVYLATLNKGIYVTEGNFARNISFSPVNVSGIPLSNGVTSLLIDSLGDLWVGTMDGIVFFDRKHDNVVRLRTEDGLSDNQCYVNSAFKLSDGRMAFGTINGLSVVSSVGEWPPVEDRQVRVTSLVINSPTGQIVDHKAFPSEISIPSGMTSASIRFSCLDFLASKDISYSYTLDSDSDDWTVVGEEKQVSFSDLAAGWHNLRLRSTNADGKWSENVTTVRIRIEPEFYQTAWFALLVILSLILAILFVFIYDRRRSLSIRRALEKELAKSTEQVEEQNILLKEQNAEALKQKLELEEYVKKLEVMSNDRKMLYTNLIHGFKTPITLIKGPVETLRRMIGGKYADVDESIGIISRNTDEMLSLVSQMLESQRNVDSGIKIVNSSFGLAVFFDIVENDYGMIFGRKNLTVHFMRRVCADRVVSDRNALYKIACCLLNCVVKYSPENGRVAIYFAEMEGEEPGVMMSVHLLDAVISDENWEKDFLESDLSSVSSVVNVMHGRFLSDRSSSGVKLRVTVPVEIELPDQMESQNSLESEDSSKSRPVLLLAEDNEDMRLYIRSVLGSEYNIVEATNGLEGFETAQKIMPDFIISDLMMPLCNGVDFCRKVREDENICHVPFLMLTALSNDDTRLASYAVGADSFLSKPFNADVLRTRVASLIESRQKKRSTFVSGMVSGLEAADIKNDDDLFRQKLLSILASKYSDPAFGAYELQDDLCLGSTTYFKKVKELTGTTPGQLIRLYRLQVARKTLEEHRGDSSFRIADCAYAVGFSDPNYFGRCYFKQFGEHPKDTLTIE